MELQHPAKDVVVVMVPLPAQGHLNQLLHLTRIISLKGIPVHFVGSAIHNRQAKDRVLGWDPSSSSNLHFHDFQLPEFITPPTDPNATNKFPSHLMPTFKAAVHLREPLGELLRSLASSNRRVAVVHDSSMPFAAEEASFVPNAEAYSFVSCCAFTMLHFIWMSLGKPTDEEENILPRDVPRISFEESAVEEFLEFLKKNRQYMDLPAGDLYNTCEAIDGRFISKLVQLKKDKKIWGIGPFNPIAGFDSKNGQRHYCLEWLDKQPLNSVIYVSFGTMTSISDEQIAELAIGLQQSEQKFIWVLRDADRGNIYSGEIRKPQLPNGFEDKVKGVGMVIRDWAPQLQILAHPSTGGFMSHCGWNSTMESLSMGLPIAAWPMHSDQPSNAVLITEVLKVGLLVRDWSRRKELISSYDIKKSIRKLMVSNEGKLTLKRAKELGVDIRHAVSEGGTSTAHLESFLTHICR